ncbi:MAG: hypothetical protein GF398_00645 [Chitinivibrionales bacterium]|nr:hypothetical protein [Chitinivibrionales bacterium]
MAVTGRCAGLLTALIALAALAQKPDVANTKPVARIKESVICCPAAKIVLDGWASIDPRGEIKYWQWDLGADGEIDTTTSVGELALTAPLDSKTYPVALTVVDSDENRSLPDTAMIHIMKSRPRVRLQPDDTVQIGTRIFFEPQVFSNCGIVRSYEWDLDSDGASEYRSANHGNTSKVFFRPGKYQARFRATDSYGHCAEKIRTIIVTARAPGT